MPDTGASDRSAGLPLRVEGLRVSARGRDGSRLSILDIPRLALPAGATVAVTGPSGSGKSSLLGALAGIVRPEAGRVLWGEDNVSGLPEPARDRWRRRRVGFVFQDFHLVPELDVLSNILLPATFDRVRVGPDLQARAAALAAAMGLPDLRRRAALLSRGEQQRTAVARALLREPALLLADEPTASLDPGSGRAAIDLLLGAATASGATLVVASHDPALLERIGMVWRLEAGRLAAGEPAA